MKRILILTSQSLANDQRILRQIHWLKDDYAVTTLSAGPSRIPGVRNHVLAYRQKSPLQKIARGVYYKLGFFEKNYWDLIDFQGIAAQVGNADFDLIIANDYETLPLAARMARSAKILFDAHEYAPGHFDNSLYWRFLFKASSRYICRKYIPLCHAMTTVTAGLARLYQREFNIKPIVITNAADYCACAPSPVDKDKIRIITHGNAHPFRKIELMIASMDFADERFHLDLMLMPTDPKYLARLKKMALSRSNVRIIDPVPSAQIISFANAYDLAFLVFQPITINYKYGLGNKYFECIQSRLGIITGPFPQPQAELTAEHHCGIVLPEYAPRSIGRRISALDAAQIAAFKANAHKAAAALSSRWNADILKQLVADMLDGRTPR